MSIISILQARSRLRAGKPAARTPVTVADVLRIFDGAKVVQPPMKEPATTITVRYPHSYLSPPVSLAQGVTVYDVEKFVKSTVADLERYVLAVNTGRGNWLSNAYLVNEWVQNLAQCGVSVDISGTANAEPDLKPLDTARRESRSRPEHRDQVLCKHLSGDEVRDLFKELGIDPDDRTGLPPDILKWLERCDAIQARTRDAGPLALTKEPIDWSQNATAPTVSAWTAKDIAALKSKQGKGGGVFCRSCYTPMDFSGVNGGFDYYCNRCAIVWRYRP